MKVYLLILLVAAAITYVSVPVVRHIALVTHTLTPVRSRDVHKVPVPRLGGWPCMVGYGGCHCGGLPYSLPGGRV